MNKYFSNLYMDAENAITEIRKACDFSDSDSIDLETLCKSRYELETLKGYIDFALGEIALDLEKFYKQ